MTPVDSPEMCTTRVTGSIVHVSASPVMWTVRNLRSGGMPPPDWFAPSHSTVSSARADVTAGADGTGGGTSSGGMTTATGSDAGPVCPAVEVAATAISHVSPTAMSSSVPVTDSAVGEVVPAMSNQSVPNPPATRRARTP